MSPVAIAGICFLALMFIFLEWDNQKWVAKSNMQTHTSKPPFNVGDQVSVVKDIYSVSPMGKVVDVWQVRDSWMVMVDHNGFDYAYTPNELSLDNSEVVHVDFKSKQRRT